jgi:two-component system response regulator NreC
LVIRILLADDHRIMRDGLHALLMNESDIEVVAESSDGREALELTRSVKPDIVIMDMCMPGLNGIDATRQILSLDSSIKVLALSMYADKRFIMGALAAGASGYVLKDCAFEELVKAIHTVIEGKTYLSQGILDIVVDSCKSVDLSQNQLFLALTLREREVLQLLSEGTSIRETAQILNISSKTIETHRQHIMEKLNIHSVAELTKCAIREGLTSL